MVILSEGACGWDFSLQTMLMAALGTFCSTHSLPGVSFVRIRGSSDFQGG